MNLSQAYLKTVLHYNPKSGKWTRLYKSHLQAGYRMPSGYLRIKINGRHYLSHVLAWIYMTGMWPQKVIDHKDNDKTNDRWNNLREASRTQNRVNCKIRCDNKVGYKGVHFKRKNYYQATITVQKKRLNLGFFKTAVEAHAAYQKAALRHFGEFARFR